MNENLPLAEDDIRLDRLVDGELSPDEYRALLAALDQDPSGWRSCALAFLESQALAGELGGLRRSLHAVQAASSLPAPQPGTSIWPGMRTLLAMAASFALAFGLGIGLPRFWSRGLQEPPLVGNHIPSGGVSVHPPSPRHEVLRPIGNVQLVVAGGRSGEESSDVPVYEIGQNLDEYLRQSPPGLDPRVLQWLAQHGHRVEVEQQLIPGRLEDGRPLYVPVEEYRITPVRRSY